MTDILIIGGGIAGLTAALYALRAGKSVTVIEKETFGGQITSSPRVDNYPGLPGVSGNELADALLSQVMDLGGGIEMEQIAALRRTESGFAVDTGKKIFEGKAVILATGARHRPLGLPRETTWAEAAKQLDRRLYIVDAMLEMPEELYGSESMFGAMTGSDGRATCFSMYSMNGKAYGEKVDATMYLNVKEYDAERETFSEIAEEYEHLPIFLEAPIDMKEYAVPENTVIADRFRLDSVKAVWMDAGVYVVSSFTALDGATEELAEELLGEVEPVQEDGERYPSGLNLTDTIQETSGWPEITTWRMTSVNGIPETLFLTIPEAGGERTKIELKLKEE